jgi:DNA-binding beta-propeller fold protein YncE
MNFSSGVPMRFRRVGGLAAIFAAMIICMSCGQIYRPVVIPTTTVPPNPESFHAIFSVNVNVPFNFGSAMQIDVSGDTEIGAAALGVNPTHGAILPNDSRVFVANAGSQDGTDADSVMAFFPATDSRIATGLSNPTVYSLPFGSLPVFVNTAQNNAVFVANYGTNSVSEISPATNTVSPFTGFVGSHPIAMAETPNALNLYVADEGDNTVYNLSPTDLSTQAIIQNVGNTPTWIVSRVDGQRVYVVTEGDGSLYTINTVTNVIMSTQSVGGAGANFVVYDNSLNRLYVTNPTANAVYVFDATVDPPNPLATVNVGPPPVSSTTSITTNCATYACSYGSAMPVAVAPLPNGNYFYVASYVVGNAVLSGSATTCPDTNVAAANCIIPQVTVYDARTFAQTATIFPLIQPTLAGLQAFALTPDPFCTPQSQYSPAGARFRMFAVASVDSSQIDASMCDAGSVAVINTNASNITVNSNTPNSLIDNLAAPFSAGAPQANGQPLPQTPVFLFAGQ